MRTVSQGTRLASFVVTAALLWLTTFGCLACCLASCTPGGAQGAAPAPSCCAPHACEAAVPAGETAAGDAGLRSCGAHVCPMMANAPGPAVAARGGLDQAILPRAVVASAGRPVGAAAPAGARSFAADRGDTHLRCCVFLI